MTKNLASLTDEYDKIFTFLITSCYNDKNSNINIEIVKN